MYYNINNKYYVDIDHILSKIATSKDEYQTLFRKFSGKISFSIWTTTLNSTFKRRDLIDFKTMGLLILSTNNYFSEIFRTECACYVIIMILMKFLITILICAGYLKKIFSPNFCDNIEPVIGPTCDLNDMIEDLD